MDEFIGVIKLFIGSYAPENYLICDGRSLPVMQYQALYSIIGNAFGGNSTTFNLPDLRGRVPIGVGSGPGLTPRALGNAGGAETVTLAINNIPAHSHAVNVSGASATQESPANNYPAQWSGEIVGSSMGETVTGKSYTNSAPNTTLNPNTLAPSGGNQPHNNMQPFVAINYIICVQGLYPVRP